MKTKQLTKHFKCCLKGTQYFFFFKKRGILKELGTFEIFIYF